jgi:hypothetical protein
MSPGKNPRDSPASTAGLVRTNFSTSPFCNILHATAIERNVEANYFVPTSLVSGISFSGVYRMNPENNDSNPSQKTVAVRWQSLF